MLESLEKSLESIFKDLPKLPTKAKQTLAQWWPILALIGGVLQIWAAWSLWQLHNNLSGWSNYYNTLSEVYGFGGSIPDPNPFYWVGLVALAASGVILLMAYPQLKAKAKRGWDLLFLSAVVNLGYGIVMLFADNYYGGFDTLIGTVIGSAIGFYLLFQIKDQFSAQSEAK
jgi:uncharacterized membrane protein HdeD (DUF308 family)